MNRIDKIFKNKLSHYTEEVPADMWSKIEARLPEEKKKNYILPFLAVLFFIIAFGGFYLFDTKVSENSISSGKALVKTAMISTDSKTASVESATSVSATEVMKIEEAGHFRAVNRQNIIQEYQNLSEEQKELLKSTESDNVTSSADAEKITDQKEILSDISTLATLQAGEFTVSSLATLPKYDFKKSLKIPFRLKEKESKGCPFYSDAQNKSLDFYFSNDFGVKSLTSADANLSDHIQIRNQTERGLYSYSAGIRFGYNVSYRWNVHTGVNYSQINEKFEYTDPESNQTRIITIKDYVYENGKVVDSIITEEYVVVPGTTKMKIFNNYRTFDIPVMGRYTLLANRLYSLSGIVGIYINLTSRQSGMILATDNKTVLDMAKENANNAPLFKTQLGVSGMGGLSLALHLTSNVDFLVEPHARVFPSFMNTERYPANQKFTVVGVSTGIRYKF